MHNDRLFPDGKKYIAKKRLIFGSTFKYRIQFYRSIENFKLMYYQSTYFIHLLTRTFNLCNLVKQLLHLLHLLTYLPTSFQSLDRYISLKSVLFFVFIYWLHIQQAYSICDKQYMPMLFLNFISQWTIGVYALKVFWLK